MARLTLLPLLSLTLLAAACSAPAPESTPAPAAEPSATPAPEATAAPTPAAEATPRVVQGQPWTNADAGPQGNAIIDKLTFWGWSVDGTKYAFETYDHGPGAVECEGAFALRVVDATTDRFVDGGKLDLKHESPEPAAGGCTPVDLKGAFEAQRGPFLQRHGIVVGNVGEVVTSTAGGPNGGTTFTLRDGRQFALGFEVFDDDRDNVMTNWQTAGARFRLTLDGREIESGARKRKGIWNYSIFGTPVFVSPDGKHAALAVKTVHVSYEGDRHSFMTNGVVLNP
jgi:hypothetical protein